MRGITSLTKLILAAMLFAHFSLVATLVSSRGSLAADVPPSPSMWFSDAPDWLNVFLCVDLVKLGYAPPDVAWGMKFKDGEYVGGLSPYARVTVAQFIVQCVLICPQRVKEMHARSPQAYRTLVRAIVALQDPIASLVPYYCSENARSGEQKVSVDKGGKTGNLLNLVENFIYITAEETSNGGASEAETRTHFSR